MVKNIRTAELVGFILERSCFIVEVRQFAVRLLLYPVYILVWRLV